MSLVKGQLDIWYLYKTSVSLGLTFLVSIRVSANNSYRKMNISRFFPILNALGIKIGLVVKKSRSVQIHHLCKPGRPHIPNTTYQVPRPLAFWFQSRRHLEGFYLIWAWRSSWSCDHLHLLYIYSPQLKKSPYEI